jgi:hypothetical protein
MGPRVKPEDDGEVGVKPEDDGKVVDDGRMTESS